MVACSPPSNAARQKRVGHICVTNRLYGVTAPENAGYVPGSVSYRDEQSTCITPLVAVAYLLGFLLYRG